MSHGISLRNLREKKKGVLEQSASKKERELYKEWFQEMKLLFEEFYLFEYWYEGHQEEANMFLKCFIDAFNRIAKELRIPVIPPMANPQ